MTNLREWLAEQLVCPRHRVSLVHHASSLACAHGCSFPIVDGVPVMLLAEQQQTIGVATSSLTQKAHEGAPWYLETLGISDEEKYGILALAETSSRIDPVVSYLVGATNGIAYKGLIGRLESYPLPDIPLPEGGGRLLLDLGCSWGRWILAAARQGYRPIGIDPSLGAVMAARRVAASLGVDAAFIVGDARFLPLRSSALDVVYSYSVLQHLSPDDVQRVVREVSRVLKPGGQATVQMPTHLGIRCLYHQARRRFRTPVGFEVRYWSLPGLRRAFSAIGPVRFSVDCYFGIGLQRSDLPLLSGLPAVAVRLSEAVKRLATVVSPLVWLADSVFVRAEKTGPS